MIDTYFKNDQNQFLHLDIIKILSAPLHFLLGLFQLNSNKPRTYKILFEDHFDLFFHMKGWGKNKHKMTKMLWK